jgi:hypothetical protein
VSASINPPVVLPDSKGGQKSQHRERQASATIAMANRLAHIPIAQRGLSARVRKLADRLMTCATNTSGWRCDSVACPRCQARAAKKWRRELERRIAATPRNVAVAHLTLSLGHDSLGDGRTILIAVFARLRRRAWWSVAVMGGIGQVEFLPAVGRARRWNVHAHTLLWLRRSIDSNLLRREWVLLLGEFDLPGSSHLSVVSRRFVRSAISAVT